MRLLSAMHPISARGLAAAAAWPSAWPCAGPHAHGFVVAALPLSSWRPRVLVHAFTTAAVDVMPGSGSIALRDLEKTGASDGSRTHGLQIHNLAL